MARTRWDIDGADAGVYPEGATLKRDNTAWILVGPGAHRRLGGALYWANQQHVSKLHLLVDNAEESAVVARRADQFVDPPTVWYIDGTELYEAVPADPPVFPVPPPTAELFRPLLNAAGLEVVPEQGELLAEFLGLEVARIVNDPAIGDGSAARLEVGVGRFDREAFALMNQGMTDADALEKAVATIRTLRAPGAPRHPVNQLAPERWIRAAVVAEPSLVGARELTPVESALTRHGLKEQSPATALGTDLAGRPLVVTCSSGVDLDLLPSAADDRLAHAPGARLIVALPERDILPATRSLAESLRDPAEIVPIEAGWLAGT